MVSVNSQWYPYEKVQTGYIDMSQAEFIPRMICDYILDAPSGDYEPKDDNSFARCKLWKYLYYDEPLPLKKPLPTIAQKKSVLFTPEEATNSPEKQFRLIPQAWIKQSQAAAQTRLYVYLGRTQASQNDYEVSLSVVFDVWTHYTLELNTKQDQYSRLMAIEQAIIQAFNGVNMTGVGTFHYSKACHTDCGSKIMADKNQNIGRQVIMGLKLATTQDQIDLGMDNMPIISTDGKITLG